MQRGTQSKAVDPRPARTRASIYEAATRLASEPGQTISVNAIIRASGVSRSGFYSHFTGLDDLLVAMVSEAFRDIATTYAAAAKKDPTQAARQAQVQLVAFIDDRRTFIRSSLDWPVSSHVHEIVTQAYADGVRDAIEARMEAAPAGTNVDDLATFIAGGAIAMLTNWVREGDESAPQSVMATRLLSVLPDWLIGSSGDRPETSPRHLRSSRDTHAEPDLAQ